MTDFLIKLFVKNYEKTEDRSVREKYGTFSSIVGIILNAILAAMKMIVGIISGSLAILADGINNLSDAGSSGVTFISFKIASKPADRDHPFGHARIEYVASLIVSFLIINVGFDLFADSVKHCGQIGKNFFMHSETAQQIPGKSTAACQCHQNMDASNVSVAKFSGICRRHVQHFPALMAILHLPTSFIG